MFMSLTFRDHWPSLVCGHNLHAPYLDISMSLMVYVDPLWKPNGQFQRCLKSAFIEIVFRYTFVRIFLPMQRYKKRWKCCKKILDKCLNLWNFCTFKRLNGSLLCLFVFVYLYKAVFCASTTLRCLPKKHAVTWWFATCWGFLLCYLLRPLFGYLLRPVALWFVDVCCLCDKKELHGFTTMQLKT